MIIDLTQGSIGEPDASSPELIEKMKLLGSSLQGSLAPYVGKMTVTPSWRAHVHDLLTAFDDPLVESAEMLLEPDAASCSYLTGLTDALNMAILGTGWPEVRLESHPLLPKVVKPLDLPSAVVMVLSQESADLSKLRGKLPPYESLACGHWTHKDRRYIWHAPTESVKIQIIG